MDVALTQHDVIGAAHLDLVAVVGAEQNLVTGLGGAHIGPECDHLGPHEALRDLRGRRDQDSARRAALTLALGDPHEQAVVQHLDGESLGLVLHAPHGTVGTVPAETVSLETIDGVLIEADLVRTDAEQVRATLVIGHPHPLYGGDRHNHVVAAMQRAAHALGCHSIAVDFRGVGNSGGMHDDGDCERLDLAAACELADMIEPDGPILMAGYSFGAAVALDTTHPLVSAWLVVAPPAAMIERGPLAARNPRPKLILSPEHDQFGDPEAVARVVAEWENTTVSTIHGVDHFLAVGAEAAVTAALADLLD